MDNYLEIIDAVLQLLVPVLDRDLLERLDQLVLASHQVVSQQVLCTNTGGKITN